MCVKVSVFNCIFGFGLLYLLQKNKNLLEKDDVSKVCRSVETQIIATFGVMNECNNGERRRYTWDYMCFRHGWGWQESV